jgi:hypothetical protein
MRGEKGGLGRGEVKEYARVHATQVHIHVHGTVLSTGTRDGGLYSGSGCKPGSTEVLE